MMLPLPDFRFVRARSLAHALDALSTDGAMLLAGGTDVLPNLKRGLHAETRMLVSVRALPEIARIEIDSDGALVVGAGVTLARVADDATVRARYPALARAAALAASPQIRERATIGGNVCLDTRCAFYDQSAFWRGALGECLKTCGDTCHVVEGGRRCVAAFSADTPGPLIAYGAVARLSSPRGDRDVPLDSFFVSDGAHNTVRLRDEILVHVRLPAPAPSLESVYVKVRPRQSIDFPTLSIALAAESDRGAIRRVTLVVGSLGARPRIVDGLGPIAAGRPLDDSIIEAIAERAHASCRPLRNVDVDADWRHAVLPVYVRRALHALVPSRA